MSKKKIITGIAIIIFVLIIESLYFWILPLKFNSECKNRIFPELEDKVEYAKKSVVGIIPESKDKSTVSRNGIGSGVIFKNDNNIYYVVTAAHVVEDINSSYKIFTINTKFSGEVVKADDNINFEIPDEDYYNSLLDAKIEYISDVTDLAILSFITDENLPILEFETKKLNIGDKIVAIGHPEGNRYIITYGTIKSNIKFVTMKTKKTNKEGTDMIMEHDAYLNFGSSGGVLISENMKIAGINIGGSFNLLGYFDKGFMIPYDIVQNVIRDWNPTKENLVHKVDSWSKDKVTIQVKDISKDNTSATLEIIDKNDNPISWETAFSIQKMSEGDNNWYNLASKGKSELLLNFVLPDENGITKMKIDWSKIYRPLSKGTYRIVKHTQFITLYSEPFTIK